MEKKLLCALCKQFVNAKERNRDTGARRCDPTHIMVKETTELSECPDFELHPYIWCWAGGGRFSIEICRVASKPQCKGCFLGDTVRDLLPSKLPSFRPGDIHGMTHALQKIKEKHGNNGPSRPNVLEGRVPAFNAPLPETFIKRRSIRIAIEKPTAPANKKRKPILIRTPKESHV